MPALIIAEKPSMAADIAKALGGFTRKQGYFASSEYLLTWAVGHLVELATPEVYRPEWKAWRAATLPIIPQHFQLVPIAKTEAQLKIIKKLAFDPSITECINACDAGREGELIFRYIMDLISCRKPVRRLWVSSLTGSAIRRGFQELAQRPQNELRFEQLFQAARCRSEADWLVGINATRAVTIRQRQVGKSELYSLGRVQTPTLAIMVQREAEIAAFEPRPFWEIEATFRAPDEPDLPFTGRWFKGEEDRLWSEEAVRLLLAKLQSDGMPAEGKVIGVKSKERREAAPLLYDLTSLQREANRRYGFAASRTLKAAQSLYERYKLISYPRTDSRFLTPDLIPSLPRRIQAGEAGSPYAAFIAELKLLPKLPISGRLVNAAKVRDHHALIPTETTVPWGSIGGDERRVLELIHQAFLAAFFPDALWLDREIVCECRDELFRSKEARLLEPGWRKLHQRQAKDAPDEAKGEAPAEAKLPLLHNGQAVFMEKLSAQEGVTKPPARYSEGTLLSAMERAGSLLDDEALQEAMRDSGLGTAATRAATIDRLKHMQYIEEKSRELCPTAKGIALIQELPVPALRSPELTGQWEAKLAAIQEGAYDPQRFMGELTVLVSEITAECLSAAALKQDAALLVRQKASEQVTRATAEERNAKPATADNQAPADGNWGPCPLCGAAVHENRKAYYCSNWRGEPPCGFTLWKQIAGKTLTVKQVQTLLQKGKTGVLKGFRSQKGTRFDAILILEQGKVVFQFQKRESKPRKSNDK